MSSDPSRPAPRVSPDDDLPLVEPPSAGFLVQLFVVPGVIVLVVVMIWVLFNWLAQKGNDRDAFVRALQRNNEARWQAAFNLANALRAERKSTSPTLVTDAELARQLAAILSTETAQGSLEENPLALRVYLSRALGEFRVPDGLPALIEAATTVRDPKEQEVRRAALEGIALLADNVKRTNKPAFDDKIAGNAQLQEVLLAAAADEDVRTRNVAAVALGVVGTPKMLDKLHFMLEDASPDVRYNAAARLAQHGDAAAIPVLLEMLDPAETAGVDVEKDNKMKAFKRALITVNALKAAQQLAAKNPDADTSAIQASVGKLLAGDLAGEVRMEAKSLAAQLAKRGAAAAK